MYDPIMYVLGSVLVLAAIIAIFASINHILSKKRTKKMYLAIDQLLDSIVALDKDNIHYQKNGKAIASKKNDTNSAYEYILNTPNYKYYIKVVPNHDNQEICVNNSVKWQLRKSFNDETLRFVPEVDLLMRLDIPPYEENKIVKKIYIIYPNARSLLKYINECEMEFVHPVTDVYGTNIIAYVNLVEHLELINL